MHNKTYNNYRIPQMGVQVTINNKSTTLNKTTALERTAAKAIGRWGVLNAIYW